MGLGAELARASVQTIAFRSAWRSVDPSNHFTAMWDRAMTLRNEIVLNTSMCVKGLSDDACVATWVENSLARDPMAAASGGSARGRRAIDASTVDASRVEPVTDDARRGIVFIVGASRGIGLGLAQRFHAEGWKVHATVRDIAQPGAVGMLSKDRLTLYPLDVSNQAQIVALQERVTRDALAIDVLIHNAGVQTTNLTLAMAINAHAPFEVARALMPAVLRPPVAQESHLFDHERGRLKSAGASLEGPTLAVCGVEARPQHALPDRGASMASAGSHCCAHAPRLGEDRNGRG